MLTGMLSSRTTIKPTPTVPVFGWVEVPVARTEWRDAGGSILTNHPELKFDGASWQYLTVHGVSQFDRVDITARQDALRTLPIEFHHVAADIGDDYPQGVETTASYTLPASDTKATLQTAAGPGRIYWLGFRLYRWEQQ